VAENKLSNAAKVCMYANMDVYKHACICMHACMYDACTYEYIYVCYICIFQTSVSNYKVLTLQ